MNKRSTFQLAANPQKTLIIQASTMIALKNIKKIEIVFKLKVGTLKSQSLPEVEARSDRVQYK